MPELLYKEGSCCVTSLLAAVQKANEKIDKEIKFSLSEKIYRFENEQKSVDKADEYWFYTNLWFNNNLPA